MKHISVIWKFGAALALMCGLVAACGSDGGSDDNAAGSVEEFCTYVGQNGDSDDFGPDADPDRVAAVYAEFQRLAPTDEIEQAAEVIKNTMAEYYEVQEASGADAAYSVLLDPDYMDASVAFLDYVGKECFEVDDSE